MKISTRQSTANIDQVKALLAEMPDRLTALQAAAPAGQLQAPLEPGQWSAAGQVIHLLCCAELVVQAIQYALLLEAHFGVV